MPRPREFDPGQVLEKAMKRFWEHGYSATSIADLLKGTRLARGSLYAAFGDKRRLFQAALEKYDGDRYEAARAKLALRGPVKKVLRAWLVEAATTRVGKGHRDCLIHKAAMELAPHDAEFMAWLRAIVARNERLIAGVLERGKRSGEVRADLKPLPTARYILTSLAGLRAFGVVLYTEKEVCEAVDLILRVLE